MKPKVYLETTIISYFAARPSRDIITAAHQQITQEWWEGRRNNFDVFISQIVLQEVNEGDKDAVQRRMGMIESVPEIEVNPEAVALAQALVSDGIVPEKAAAECASYCNCYPSRHGLFADMEFETSGECNNPQCDHRCLPPTRLRTACDLYA